jgi:Flp pilus assembly protein TadG
VSGRSAACTRARPSTGRRSIGQALVEFALVAPIFFAVVFGLIDGARLIFAYNTVSQEAREAVRLAAVQVGHIAESPCSAPVCPANTTALLANVAAQANNMNAVVGTISTIYVTCTAAGTPAPTGNWTAHNDCASSASSGNTVSVRLLATIIPLTPVFSIPFPTIGLSASASMVIP